MWRKTFTFALFMVLALFLGYRIIHAINNKQQIREAISTLPAFEFYTIQNKPYTKDSLLQNQSTLFLFFNTTCEHCQYETEQILKNANQLVNKNVLFISGQSIPEIKAFDSIYHLTNYPFIKLLRDSTNNFYKTFGTSMVPRL